MNLSEMKLGDRVTIEAVKYTGCRYCALIGSCDTDIMCPEDMMFSIVPQPEQPQEPTPHWSEKFKAAERAGKRVEWHSEYTGWGWSAKGKYPNGENTGGLMWDYDYYGAKESDFRIVEEQPQDWREKLHQARAEGKVIQGFRTGGNWFDENQEKPLTFECSESQYRIKPEPKYRPLNAQEMKKLVGKIICCDNNIYNVLAFSEIDDQLTVGIIGDIWITNHALMDKYTYPDGKPVAVEVTK